MSFYECFAATVKSRYENIECLPKVFKSLGKIDLSEFDTCKNESSDSFNTMVQLYDLFMTIDGKVCPKSCDIKKYLGEIVFRQDWGTNYTFETLFEFASPYKVKVKEEYLIYDFIGLVGSVGGTLGLFIGFSFYDIISRFCNKLRNL